MINSLDLREGVIRPALENIGLWCPKAEELVIGTAAQESELGFYLKQRGGPALGPWQIEPITHDDNWRYLLRDDKRTLYERIIKATGYTHKPLDDVLIWDLYYGAIMCRIKYWMAPQALPKADDIKAMARYWKQYYNTEHGKGEEANFLVNYKLYILGE